MGAPVIGVGLCLTGKDASVGLFGVAKSCHVIVFISVVVPSSYCLPDAWGPN